MLVAQFFSVLFFFPLLFFLSFFFCHRSLQVMLFFNYKMCIQRHTLRIYENISKPCRMKQFSSLIGLRRPAFECEMFHRCFAMIHLAENTAIKMIELVPPNAHSPHEYHCGGIKLDVAFFSFSP